ncbi:MAG TPA: valine--tRNA ligase [Mesorhizobium sp.]|jgi:valyl-tRNA synthetase|nr:valine--tRNA ligase [Mesorhizobium sp.]
MLDKTYDAKAVEPRIAELWESEGAFRAGAGADEGAAAFTVVIPPPNVTGSLHIGHALNNTLQDVLVRFERMRGRNVLWQPGMDHAGIATQMVVERQLGEQGIRRRELSREEFIDRVWRWKAQSGGAIIHQLKRLGASCDWSRERFTMDEGLSQAVIEVFVRLYKDGLIYRDKRLVNWDPALGTAISDLEVENREVDGHLWHFRYPLEGVAFDPENPATFITVATTRPETMLGDTGVAVHPEDERFRALVGRNVVLPLVGRRIPVVADEYSDPEKGTGAVKITPAHDFNDFEVGRRHGLRAVNVMTPEATMLLRDNDDFLDGLDAGGPLAGAWAELHGLDRSEARSRVVALMVAGGFLAKVEPHRHTVPHGDRGGVPIEPFLTDQWYVNAAELARPAVASVREGRTSFVPKNWEKTYFEWMENIQPWCVSRQLWWGHRIPAWYGPDGAVFVERTEEEALGAAIQHYIAHEGPMKAVVEDLLENFRPGEILTRDEDVLDTWFSSALWPFSTLGWPEETEALRTYYPTDVLVTGFDIIFFWVARMMMMGLQFTDREPFHTVYVHALVRDKHGAKMSKSKGNVIDPLELIDEYGADALRFTLAIMAAQGRDVKLDPARVAGYRNFGTKLWNATRFAQMNGVAGEGDFLPSEAGLTVNRWVLTELTRAAREITDGVTSYRFNDAAAAAYRFVWNTVCDWYLELLKPIFAGADEAAKQESRLCAAHVLNECFKLLHPFMPFMTEELWSLTGGETGRERLLCHSRWPEPAFEDAQGAAEINWLIELVGGIRSVRSEMNVPPAAVAPLVVLGARAETRQRLARHEAALKRLARVGEISEGVLAPPASAQIVLGEATVCLPLGSLIDLNAEAIRLRKEQTKVTEEIARLRTKLANERFVANAPPELVEAEREKLAAFQERQIKLDLALSRLRADA